MLSPRPYGLLVKGDAPTERDMAFIESVARHLTNFKGASELESLKWQWDLPDGGHCVVQDMGGTFRVITMKGELTTFEPTGFAEMYIPSMFSGVITRDMVRQDIGEGVGIKLTDQCRRRLGSYAANALENVPKDVYLQRFVIEYADKFKYFLPQYTGIYTFTQYMKQRPTWYSGSMSEVMQVVGGYGRLDYRNLPENPLERSRVRIPDSYLRQMTLELADTRLAACTGFPPLNGAFEYEYKHSTTNTILFSSDNKPWLTRISSSGVYAMPLPMIPATTTSAFKKYIEDVGDNEILSIIDKFGGMPSGENFPSDIEPWIRAGVVIKLCEAGDFYQHNAMYDACGWAVNSKGIEGFNTCWSYEGDLKHVHSYKMRLEVGPFITPPNQKAVNIPSELAPMISDYLKRLSENLGNSSPKALAIYYKLRRVGIEKLLERVRTGHKNDVDFWDSLVIDPIANGKGSINRVYSGPIYIGITDNPLWQGRLKFPTLDGVGCASFDMTSPDYKGDFVKCDTVVFGSYVEDELKVIKYFIDNREFTKDEYSTYEPFMYVGQWEKQTVTGMTGLMGNFYTTDFDDRQEKDPVTTYTNIKGTDLGYGNTAYSTPALLFVRGGVGRSRYYKHITTTHTTRDRGIDAAACVPVYTRDAILYPFSEYIGSETNSEIHTMGGVADPTSYEMWTYDPIFHYMWGGGKGQPQPKTGEYVYIDKMNYEPDESNEFADSGNWLGFPQGSYLDISHIAAPYTSRASGNHHAGGVTIGGEAPSIEPFSQTITENGKSKGVVKISVKGATASEVYKRLPDAWYYTFSPVEAGGSLSYFYRDACYVTMGATEYTTVSEKDQYGRRKRWGSCKLVDDTRAYHFIGVINE